MISSFLQKLYNVVVILSHLSPLYTTNGLNSLFKCLNTFKPGGLRGPGFTQLHVNAKEGQGVFLPGCKMFLYKAKTLLYTQTCFFFTKGLFLDGFCLGSIIKLSIVWLLLTQNWFHSQIRSWLDHFSFCLHYLSSALSFCQNLNF
jgi:hypothetical protein